MSDPGSAESKARQRWQSRQQVADSDLEALRRAHLLVGQALKDLETCREQLSLYQAQTVQLVKRHEDQKRAIKFWTWVIVIAILVHFI